MAQFDIYANPNVAQREIFPYLVQIQSDQLSGFSTRLVIPLQRMKLKPADLPRRLSQVIEVKGERLYPSAHFTAAILTNLLKKPVASISSDRTAILDALDAVVSGV